MVSRPRADVADGTDQADVFAKHSKVEIDDGTAIVKEFLETWHARVAAQDPDDKLGDEDELAVLKATAEEYKAKFEGSPWIQTLLANF
jgi:DNA mismatch repair protein MSH2